MKKDITSDASKCLLIAVIGGTNQGKSYFVKQAIKDKNKACFVFDVQDGYGATSKKEGDLILNLPIATHLKRCRFMGGGGADAFLQHCHHRRHTNIVIEEATIFFEGRTQQAMRKVIVDKWHNKNTIFILFHSINAVPPRILEMTDIVVLFKTADEPNIIKRKYSKLLPYFEALKTKPDRSKAIIKNI